MTLERKILLTLFAIAVIPLAIVGGLLLRHESIAIEEANDHELTGAARILSHELDGAIEEKIESVRAAANLPAVQSFIEMNEPERAEAALAFGDLLRRLAASDPINLLGVSLLEANGVLVAQTGIRMPGLSDAHAQYFKQVIDEGLPCFSVRHYADVNGQPTLCAAAPVRNSTGDIIGVLRYELAVSWLQQVIVKHQHMIPEAAWAMLAGEDGVVLANTEDPETKLRTKIELGEQAHGDCASLAHDAPLPGNGPAWAEHESGGVRSSRRATSEPLTQLPWAVVVWQDRAAFTAGSRHAARVALLAGVLVLGLLYAAAWQLAAGICGPIRRLTEGARRIADGDIGAEMPRGEPGELGVLADAVTTMATNLQAMIDGLEVRHGESLRTAAELKRVTFEQQAILESANAGIISVAADGTVLTFNTGAEKLLGYRAEDLTNISKAPMFFDPEELTARRQELGSGNHSDMDAVTHGVTVGSSFEREWRMRRRNGTFVPVALSVTAILDDAGDASGYLLVANDITVRKQAEAEMIRARDAAEAASMAKSQFLANMGHEIRTPMNAILGFVDQLGDPGSDPATERERIDIIRRNAHQLLHIVNDVLDISRLDSGAIVPAMSDCSPLGIAEEVVRLHLPRAQEMAIGLTLECLTPVPALAHTDGARLRQVLSNIVGNAVKFTERGAVRVTVSAGPPEDGKRMLTLSVIDTGPGIDEAAMATLFSPFNQADSGMARRHGGTGLGLALSRKLAMMLGGNVTATSRKGEGSVFTIAIPVGVVACSKDISGVEQLSAAAAPRPSEEKLTGRVLVVEDGLDNQRLIGLLLRKLGLEVTIAENGLEGIKLLSYDRDPDRGLCNPCPYDLVLMDMQMPVLDGYTATARLRESGSTVAIVALTAHSLEGDRQRCLDAGCTDYATKPVDRARLASLCRKWLGKSHTVAGSELTDAAANS